MASIVHDGKVIGIWRDDTKVPHAGDHIAVFGVGKTGVAWEVIRCRWCVISSASNQVTLDYIDVKPL